MKFMEDYTANWFDAGGAQDDYKDWHTSDFTFTKPDGTSFSGIDKAWPAIKENYGPLAEYSHIPYYGVTTEVSDGWQMIGQATVYANLVGQPAADEQKLKDAQGKEWDVAVPAAFKFHYVKDDGAPHHGIRLQSTEIHADNVPIVMTLVKRGVMKL